MREEILAYFTPEQRRRLQSARVGVAGAGGLGSNAAMMLARSGVGHILIIDGDAVEASNLNRQYYLPRHLGMPKVTALSEQLHELDPELDVDARHLWLDGENIPALLPLADIWLEAVDKPAVKALLASHALKAGKPMICASGMGGVGGLAMKRRILKGLTVVGDFCSDIAWKPPLAPRVIQCSAMQTDAVLEWILTGTISPLH